MAQWRPLTERSKTRRSACASVPTMTFSPSAIDRTKGKHEAPSIVQTRRWPLTFDLQRGRGVSLVDRRIVFGTHRTVLSAAHSVGCAKRTIGSRWRGCGHVLGAGPLPELAKVPAGVCVMRRLENWGSQGAQTPGPSRPLRARPHPRQRYVSTLPQDHTFVTLMRGAELRVDTATAPTDGLGAGPLPNSATWFDETSRGSSCSRWCSRIASNMGPSRPRDHPVGAGLVGA